MNVLQKSKYHILKSGIVAIILLFGITTITVAADTSTVSIDPLSQTVSSGEDFTVNGALWYNLVDITIVVMDTEIMMKLWK